MEPEKVSALVAAFTDPEVTLWFSDADLIDEDGQPWQRRAWEPVTFDASAQAELMAGSAMRLLHGQTVAGATMAIRASVLEAALPLPVDMDKGKSSLFLHDGWLAVVASTFGRVLVDPRPLTRYRQHAKQVTGMGMIVGNRIGPPGTPLEIDTARATAVAAVAGPNAAGDEVRATAAFLRDRRGSQVAIIRSLLSGDYGRHARGSKTALGGLLRTYVLKSRVSPLLECPPLRRVQRLGLGGPRSPLRRQESDVGQRRHNHARARHHQCEIPRRCRIRAEKCRPLRKASVRIRSSRSRDRRRISCDVEASSQTRFSHRSRRPRPTRPGVPRC